MPLRGSKSKEMLAPPLLRLATSVPSSGDLGGDSTPLTTLLFMLEGDERVNQLVWYPHKPGGLSRGYLPAATLNQLWAVLLSWSFHTTVDGFDPSIGPSHALIAFGQHRLLLRRIEGQPAIAVTISGTVQPSVLERLRLLLRDVLAKSPYLRCALLLPLPSPLTGAYIAYDPLMNMSATQGAVVLGQHLTQTVIMHHLAAILPQKAQAFYDLMLSCAPVLDSNSR